jgi:hypothetical protein
MNEEKKSPYRKSVHYTFTVREEWAIFAFGDGWVAFEETRKNGQEDCHMSGEAELVDGKWVLDEGSRRNITMYSYEDEADGIEAYFNKHGMPQRFDPLARAKEIRETLGSSLRDPGAMINHLIAELEAGRILKPGEKV